MAILAWTLATAAVDRPGTQHGHSAYVLPATYAPDIGHFRADIRCQFSGTSWNGRTSTASPQAWVALAAHARAASRSEAWITQTPPMCSLPSTNGAVGDEQVSTAIPYDGGGVGRTQTAGEHPCPLSLKIGIEACDILVGLLHLLGRSQRAAFDRVHAEQVLLHWLPLSRVPAAYRPRYHDPSAPPGSSITPSRDTNSDTTTLLMIFLPCERRLGAGSSPFIRTEEARIDISKGLFRILPCQHRIVVSGQQGSL